MRCHDTIHSWHTCAGESVEHLQMNTMRKTARFSRLLFAAYRLYSSSVTHRKHMQKKMYSERNHNHH